MSHVDELPASPHVQAWNDVVGPKFLRFREVLVRNGAAHHALALDYALPGDCVLDVGCGFGDTAAILCDRVGPAGRVVGVDCTDAFTAIARREAPRAEILTGDAERMRFGRGFDVVFSRFGTMFFTFPAAGLANLRRSLVPGGALVMVTWAPLADNPWLALPRAITHAMLPLDEPARVSCGPGPFSLSDRDTVRAILASAGFEHAGFERVEADVYMGADVDEAVDFQLAIGPSGERVREASARGPVDLAALRDALCDALAPYARADGVFMRSASWTIAAQ